MHPDSGLAAISHVIQLAVAPVFLLSGVGALLAVLTNRLARVIDRARAVEARLEVVLDDGPPQPDFVGELKALSRRSRLINWAITLVTVCALLVCAVIAALFLGGFFQADIGSAVSLVFIAAMMTLIGGLLIFLLEINVATRALRDGPPFKGL